MGAEDGELYILRPDEDTEADDDDEAWVSPQPASEVIMTEVADAVDAEPDDFDSLDAYVDIEALVAVFDGDEDEHTFEVEDHEVTVTKSGDIEVEADEA